MQAGVVCFIIMAHYLGGLVWVGGSDSPSPNRPPSPPSPPEPTPEQKEAELKRKLWWDWFIHEVLGGGMPR